MEIIIDNEIKLKEIDIDDANEIFDLIDNNREYLREWLPFVDTTKKVEDTLNFIKSVRNKNFEEREITTVIIYKGQKVGVIGFRDTDKLNHRTEIGYWLAKKYQGNGIIIRSCKSLINYAFNNLNINRITIRYAVENIKSSKIPKKLNFKFEGIEREGEYINGIYHDLNVYGLLKKEWEK
ncbi:MAG: GNAT family N-acetyltransferase [Bacteroidales bacterium]|nr:GNAT family N-acetyltransferase [Bacteroidales bacterium]